ncbi:MAG: DUF5615 family PIN-like protein [Gammaproteobacteria bacterium]|nr:DUF5615 family PIN-like protein [Gammaproteobacteria bacterium]
MRFLVDRCAGRHVALWLRGQGHDAVDARELGADPGDLELLACANAENRILITLDTDFGELIYLRGLPHAGLVRLPDVPMRQRIQLMAQLIEESRQALEAGAVVTVRGGRIRVSRQPSLQ